MACGSGCCGAPQPVPLEQSAPAVPPIADNAEKCCNEDDTEDPAESSEDSCQDACCDGLAVEKLSDDPSEVPSCCKGKPFPCCDSSCIDRLALRECHGMSLILSPLLTVYANPWSRHHLIHHTRFLYARLEWRTMPPTRSTSKEKVQV